MRCEARINGPSIYLDHWAIVRLAEKEPGLRQRFLNLIRLGMELLFSVANAAELAGSQGKSADDVRSFLAGIGPRWFPVELDTVTVLKRENQGIDIAQLAASGAFVESFVKFRMRSISPDKLVSFDDDFFSLAGALDWVVSQRESIKEGCAKFDQVLREKCLKAFARGKQEGKAWVDQRFPQVPFDENRRVNFVWRNLMRMLIKEPQSIKKGTASIFRTQLSEVYSPALQQWTPNGRSESKNCQSRIASHESMLPLNWSK